MRKHDEHLQLFIEDSLEHLDGVEADLLNIEKAGSKINFELVNKVFRAVHTIKGSAGFMELNNIEELSHVMESTLNRIRNSELIPSPEIISILLAAADDLTEMVKYPGKSDQTDISDHVSALQNSHSSSDAAGTKDEAPGAISASTTANIIADNNVANDLIEISFGDQEAVFAVEKSVLRSFVEEGNFLYLLKLDPVEDLGEDPTTIKDKLEELEKGGSVVTCNFHRESGELVETIDGTDNALYVLFATVLDPEMAPTLFEIDETKIHNLDIESISGNEGSEGDQKVINGRSSEEPASREPETTDPVSANGKPVKASTLGSLRVNLDHLDKLMSLAGELVLIRNQMLQKIKSNNNEHLFGNAQQLDFITSQLQESIMSTHTQPVGNIFKRFRRLSRDLSNKLNKKITVVISGQDVELDKTIIEKIGDPLTHIVRNSIDHGIELPEVRKAAGKPSTGTIEINAYHEGGHVFITMSDDGKGIDPEKLKEQALAKGTIDKLALENMSQDELLNIIFLPGFSTAQELTGVSGRGVGMDVVKTNINDLGGSVSIHSEVGKGTKLQIKLPLTLAIISSLLIKVGRDVFAVPQVNVIELIRIPQGDVKRVIEKIGNAPVIRLRDQLIPLVKLIDFLGVQEKVFKHPVSQEMLSDRRTNIHDRRGRRPDTPKSKSKFLIRTTKERRSSPLGAMNIIVVNAGNLNYGIVVDALLDSEEIVVKPLGRHFRDIKGYSGATILGDGRVALILDVIGIGDEIQFSKITRVEKKDILRREVSAEEETQSLLIVQDSHDDFFGIPLELVTRIEKIDENDIEITSGIKNVRYRGLNVPVVLLDEINTQKHHTRTKKYTAVILSLARKKFGITVSKILSLNKSALTVDKKTFKRPGILGSIYDKNKTVQILDIKELLKSELPDVFKSIKAKPGKKELPDKIAGSSLLAFQADDGAYYAIPGEYVKDTVTLTSKNIDKVGGTRYGIYREKSLPLMSLAALDTTKSASKAKNLHMVMFPLGGKDIGLVVSKIVNYVRTSFKIDEVTLKRPGVFGSIIIENHTTQILDLYGLAEKHLSEIVELDKVIKSQTRKLSTLLIADDSEFFRNMIKDYTRTAGYDVHVAQDGQEAFNILDSNEYPIDLLITDIEMPNVNGLELTRMVRNHDTLAQLPIVAVSTLSDEESRKRGMNAGVDIYLAKLDKEKILKSVESLLIN